MRALILLSLGLLIAGSASAQPSLSAVDAPDVKVTDANWRRELHIPGLLEDPMQANEDHAQFERNQKILMRENKTRARSGQNQLPPLTSKISVDANEPGRELNYVYEAKVKNTGKKTIRVIVWVYSFIDPDSGTEVGQRRFTTAVNLSPRKSTTLAGVSTTPPIRIIKLAKSDREAQARYSEQIILERIEYEDGTFWQRSAALNGSPPLTPTP